MGRITLDEMRADESALTEYVESAMQRGGDKVSAIFQNDKPFFYYTMAFTIASMVLGEEATEKDIEMISRILPSVVNLTIGIADDTGMNEQALYTIVFGKEKGK